jgi:hypothetical protein
VRLCPPLVLIEDRADFVTSTIEECIRLAIARVGSQSAAKRRFKPGLRTAKSPRDSGPETNRAE